jgi:hypothetical protein
LTRAVRRSPAQSDDERRWIVEPLVIVEEEVQTVVRLIDAFSRHNVGGAPGSAA